jgi:protein gp37
VVLRPDKLDLPLRWRRPRRIFVNSMSDLFHDKVPDTYIAQVFAVMALAPRHQFIVLTKRHGRMHSLLTNRDVTGFGHSFESMARNAAHNMRNNARRIDWPIADDVAWPLTNVCLMVSAENQKWADIRIPYLLATPAALRGASLEPLLSAVQLTHLDVERHNLGMYQINALTGRNTDMGRPCPDVASLDWVIAGGESGPGARPMQLQWARSLRDQCAASDTAFFFKQGGAVLARQWGVRGKGDDPEHWPEPFPQQYPQLVSAA